MRYYQEINPIKVEFEALSGSKEEESGDPTHAHVHKYSVHVIVIYKIIAVLVSVTLLAHSYTVQR